MLAMVMVARANRVRLSAKHPISGRWAATSAYIRTEIRKETNNQRLTQTTTPSLNELSEVSTWEAR